MTYNRDLQEDKEPFMDTHKTITLSLAVMAGMLQELTFLPANMQHAMSKGFLNATELADYLVGKGIPFRQAHHFSGQAVALAEQRELGIEALPLKDLQGICPVIEDDVFAVLRYDAAVARRNTSGGTGMESVTAQLTALEHWLKAHV